MSNSKTFWCILCLFLNLTSKLTPSARSGSTKGRLGHTSPDKLGVHTWNGPKNVTKTRNAQKHLNQHFQVEFIAEKAAELSNLRVNAASTNSHKQLYREIMTTCVIAGLMCETHIHTHNTAHHFQFTHGANWPPSPFYHFILTFATLPLSSQIPISSPNFHGFRQQTQLYWLTGGLLTSYSLQSHLPVPPHLTSLCVFHFIFIRRFSFFVTVRRFFDPDQSFGWKRRQHRKQHGQSELEAKSEWRNERHGGAMRRGSCGLNRNKKGL